jgi:hypothetical protein
VKRSKLREVLRLLLTVCIAAMVLPAAADAGRATTRHPDVASRARGAAATASRRTTARRAAVDTLAASDPVALATTLAERYWGATPCGGQISAHAEQPLTAGLDATTDGWVTFESSLGANDLQAPAASYTDCTIELAAWQWPTRLEMADDWNMFCLTVVHEMGHLLGHQHSLTPGSVMAPVFTDESDVPSICLKARRRVEAVAELSRLH